MSTRPFQLYRVDDTTWSITRENHHHNQFREVRLSIPHLGNGEERFELITAIQNIFEMNADSLTRKRFRQGLRITINKPNSPANGTWDISLHRTSFGVWQIFPFTRRLPERNVAILDIRRAKERLPSRLFSTADRVATLQIQAWKQPSVLNRRLPAAIPPEKTILQESFQDPFTQLATEALETICPLFVLQESHRGGYRFVLTESNDLFLKSLSSADVDSASDSLSENRAVVSFYQNFLLREFGQETLSYIESECNIDFDAMRDEGRPLLPDHVSKCNIAANNIELPQVELLWSRLKELFSSLRRYLHPGATVADFLLWIGARLDLPLRTLRNLRRLIPTEMGRRPTVENLREFITSLVGPYVLTPLKDLPSDLFNTVVDILMPSDTERQRSFTGRKIRHLCVMGPNTMGAPNIPCPCRDLFELLHIFDELRQKDQRDQENQWEKFYELCSFVVVKKRLYRNRREGAPNGIGQTVRVGLLIPGPNVAGDIPRWFYVDAFYDGKNGDFNYVLLPACNNYRTLDNRPLPFIKLFRDTALTANVEDSWDSIMADLNPRGPGLLNPEVSIPYEWHHFFDRTIPIWMGYLILALKIRDLTAYQENALLVAQRELFLRKAFEAFISYMSKFHPEEPLEPILSWYQERRFDDIERMLSISGERLQEDPRGKKHQDLACVGHSLGGVLAQQSLFYFSARYERMPLPGHQFFCYSNGGPAMTNEQDETFMRFGHLHRELFRLSEVSWRIYHQFEAGDFLPQAGGSHLGTTGYDNLEDPVWLNVRIVVFSPLEGATDPAIVTTTAHSRRIGTAVEHHDFSCVSLTPQQLSEFDHSLFLSKNMRDIWKCWPFNYPKVLEMVRGTAGWVFQRSGLQWMAKKIEGAGIGIRDRNNVLAVRYIPIIERADTT